MSKYDPLGIYLQNAHSDRVELSFTEIEKILGFALPKYLRTYEAAWYGSAIASPKHVAKAVWQSAGYKVEKVNFVTEKVIFKRI